MIKPLVLAATTFPSNIIQAPLAGVSCAAFRAPIWRYSQPAYTCTEMISCSTLIHKSEKAQQRFIHIDPTEGPVCFQLSANNPLELAEATKRVTDYGASMIDLNCGCPVNKIRSKGAGSRLLTNPSQLYQLICAMKNNTHLPISIKIRFEKDENERFNQLIADVVSDAGADLLVVHGRHWTEHYETSCNYARIQFFVEHLKIPVVGNGDIACLNSLMKMLDTGCAGVMIGRAGVGQPWLISQLTAQLNQQDYIPPSNLEIGNLYLEHITYLAHLLRNEKVAILQARSFSKYYARKLKNKVEFCLAVNQCESLMQLEQLCLEYFYH